MDCQSCHCLVLGVSPHNVPYYNCLRLFFAVAAERYDPEADDDDDVPRVSLSCSFSVTHTQLTLNFACQVSTSC